MARAAAALLKERHETKQNDQWQVAREYVNTQLAIMKKFGSAPRLSSAAYEDLVRKVVEATK